MARKAREAAAEKMLLDKQWEKSYGRKPPPSNLQDTEASLEAARAAQEIDEVFYVDTQRMR